MKTIKEQKKQAFSNFAIMCALACAPIDENEAAFNVGFDAGVETGVGNFIAWHNSKSRPDRQIPESWYNQYRKECGE